AGDEEHEPDRTKQEQKRRPYSGDEALRERHKAHAPAFVFLRILLRKALGGGRELRLRSRDRDIVLQPADDRQVVAAAALAQILEDRVFGKRSPQLRGRDVGWRFE